MSYFVPITVIGIKDICIYFRSAIAGTEFQYSSPFCFNARNLSVFLFCNIFKEFIDCYFTAWTQNTNDSNAYAGLERSITMHIDPILWMFWIDNGAESKFESWRPPPISYVLTLIFFSSFYLSAYLKSNAIVSFISLDYISNSLFIRLVFPHFLSPTNTNILLRSCIYD